MLLKWFRHNMAFCIFTTFRKCQASFGHPAGMYVCTCMHVSMSFKLLYAEYCSKIV
jgi:hypothetical protein